MNVEHYRISREAARSPSALHLKGIDRLREVRAMQSSVATRVSLPSPQFAAAGQRSGS